MFSPYHYSQIIISNVGIFLWLAAMVISINTWGFFTFFRTYFIPYLWYDRFLSSIQYFT